MPDLHLGTPEVTVVLRAGEHTHWVHTRHDQKIHPLALVASAWHFTTRARERTGRNGDDVMGVVQGHGFSYERHPALGT